MSADINSNTIENSDFNQNDEYSDYENLITRLKNMKQIVALIEELYLEKF